MYYPETKKMSIQAQVNELKSIQNELTTLRKKSSILRKRVKTLESEIDAYLDVKDQPGLKYKGMAIIRETKQKRQPKKKNEQLSDAIQVLKQYGIDDPQKVFEEVMEARRGVPTTQRVLKIKKYNK